MSPLTFTVRTCAECRLYEPRHPYPTCCVRTAFGELPRVGEFPHFTSDDVHARGHHPPPEWCALRSRAVRFVLDRDGEAS